MKAMHHRNVPYKSWPVKCLSCGWTGRKLLNSDDDCCDNCGSKVKFVKQTKPEKKRVRIDRSMAPEVMDHD